MEGSSEAVNRQNCGGGRFYHPLAILLRNAFIISLATLSQAVSQSYDVLIVQHPDQFVAYDSFQQSIASSQEIALQPCVPIKIISPRDVLSDGMTPCAKVEVEGEIFYLLRDERGRLAGWNKLGITKVIRQTKFIEDTIGVVGSATLQLEDPFGNRRQRLAAGDHLLRYFSNGGKVYVRLLGSRPEYGWLKLPKKEKGITWDKVRSEPVRVTISPMIRDRVNSRIREANLTYNAVYSTLSKESGKRFPVPQWEADSSNNSMRFVLRPAAAAVFYKQTIQTLATTMQTYLLGTDYRVIANANTITIGR